jgi:AraC-like DNA-binding protein
LATAIRTLQARTRLPRLDPARGAVKRRMRPVGTPPRAGAYNSSTLNIDSNWHSHDLHQLLYAFEGSVELEDAEARFLLPPQLAAWIPAGVRHRTRLQGQRSASIFLPARAVKAAGQRVRILHPSALMREMVIHGMRWPIDQPEDPMARSYFKTFALLCQEWIMKEAPLHLPTTDDIRLRKAMSYTRAHLADSTFADACRAASLSERSLRRRFLALAGMSWAEYHHRARLIEAMRLLENPRRRIGEVAAAVGFESASGFSRAFRAFAGETPRRYRGSR